MPGGREGSTGGLGERLDVVAGLVEEFVLAGRRERPGRIGDVDGPVEALLKVHANPRDVTPVSHQQQGVVAAFADDASSGGGLSFGGVDVGLKALDLDAPPVAGDYGAVGSVVLDRGRECTAARGRRLRDEDLDGDAFLGEVTGVDVAVVGGAGHHDNRVDAPGRVDAREQHGSRAGEPDCGHGRYH